MSGNARIHDTVQILYSVLYYCSCHLQLSTAPTDELSTILFICLPTQLVHLWPFNGVASFYPPSQFACKQSFSCYERPLSRSTTDTLELTGYSYPGHSLSSAKSRPHTPCRSASPCMANALYDGRISISNLLHGIEYAGR
jgi:hypothetical protein